MLQNAIYRHTCTLVYAYTNLCLTEYIKHLDDSNADKRIAEGESQVSCCVKYAFHERVTVGVK